MALGRIALGKAVMEIRIELRDRSTSPIGRGQIASPDAIWVRGYGLTMDRTPSPQPSPHGRAIRFTHLENRLKDKDLDDSRSAEDRYVLGSMFVEEIRLFALRKE